MNYRRLFIKNGLIFITIVTNNRMPILIKNFQLLKNGYKNVRKHYHFNLIAYSIMPNHLHCIIKPFCINDYPKIVKSFKYSVTKAINNGVGLVNPTYDGIEQNCDNVGLVNPTYGGIEQNCDNVGLVNTRERIWQNRYWEHTIRDENDLYKHLDYIHYNPVKHNLVMTVKDWKYSSFHRFSKQGLYDTNWGSIKDIELIKDLNYE